MTVNPKAARYHTRRMHNTAFLDEGAVAELLSGQSSRGSEVPGSGIEEETAISSLSVNVTSLRPPNVGTPEQSGQPPVPFEVSVLQRSSVQPKVPKAETPEEIEAALTTISAERHSGRHLRRALQIAKVHQLKPKSEFDAVRLLREAGINPFSLASMVTKGRSDGDTRSSSKGASPPGELSQAPLRLPGDTVQLPKRAKPMPVPATERRAEVNQAAEILKMQQDIARRRRRRLALLASRMFAFVLLPTFIAGWYFYLIATPMYSVQSEIFIQKAGPASLGGSLSGLFSGAASATSRESFAVRGYLQSLEAMGRLDADRGFRAHFQSDTIDPVHRLSPEATLEAAHRTYKKFVKISYDEQDGVIRMDVIAADPEVAADWSRQLITYAEGQVDNLTQRLRGDQMRDAQEGYDAAQAALTASQRHLIELQEKFKIISSETEVGLIVGQISGLENQITQERLSLAQMESNPEPNQARMEPIKRRITTLEAQVAELRARLTDDSATETSLADIQGELLVAQADLQTRQLLLTQALQSMETSRVEANRQVRYLSLSVSPIPPDEPSYPRAFENTLVTMLILLGIYFTISTSFTILREQISSPKSVPKN